MGYFTTWVKVKKEKTQETISWCRNALGTRGIVWNYFEEEGVWFFKNESDAVMFVLTFGGLING